MTLRKRVDELVDTIQRMNAISQELGRRAKLYEQLLDRAIMGLEDILGFDDYTDKSIEQTLADIRKQLDGDGDGN